MKISDLIMGLLGAVFLLGGLGLDRANTLIAGLMAALVLTGLTILVKKKHEIPKGFWGFIFILVIIFVRSLVDGDAYWTYDFLLLNLGGLAFWWVGSYWRKRLMKRILLVLVYVGIGFLIILGAYYLFDEIRVVPWGLIGHMSNFRNHYLVGDYWAVVVSLIILVPEYWRDKRLRMVGLFGLVIVFASMSRAAIATILGTAAITMAWLNPKLPKRLIRGVLLVSAVAFLIMGSQKSILTVRPYYFQSLVGLKDNPIGVGVGNFREVSEEYGQYFKEVQDYSTHTHNWILEYVSGIGWLSIFFVAWLIYVLSDIKENVSRESTVSSVALIAMTINFMLMTTYNVPTMLWMWFLFLGINQNRS